MSGIEAAARKRKYGYLRPLGDPEHAAEKLKEMSTRDVAAFIEHCDMMADDL